MARKVKRGGTHTTLIGVAKTVCAEIDKLPPGIVKFIAPGRITDPQRTGQRRLTFVRTNVGLELLIVGDGVMKVTVHTDEPARFTTLLQQSKRLKHFTFTERERIPN